ncbi:MAG: Rab family GTPase [Caldilineaceae bacterium]|nr:GTP-binding protein [Caldilineaceae bacterium]
MISKKICLLGDFAVGKTSLVRRFVYDRFEDKYISTIGVKVSRKSLVVAGAPASGGGASGQGAPVEMSLLIWDLAGSEEFDRVRASYVRGAAGAILVCDLTRRQTFDSLPQYLTDLTAVVPDVRVAVVGNKSDLVDEQALSPEELTTFAAQLEAPAYVTSAKSGAHVDDMFRHLARAMLT